MEITASVEDDVLTVRLSGELDESECALARVRLDAILARYRYGTVIAELSELSFMDSSGIGLLLGRFKKLQAQGIPLLLANPTRTVDKVFRVSGIYRLMPKIG